MDPFAMSRPLLLVSLTCAATSTAMSCSRSGCPSGSMLEADRCVPLDCGPEGAFYADADGDGYGDPSTASCVELSGYIAVGGDCDDESDLVKPGATERCDGIDENCDGVADETFACASGLPDPCETACGSIGARGCSTSCEPVGDCIPPLEQCNAVDDDCDGSIDEGTRSLVDVGPIGSPGDNSLGIVTSPRGYVAFLYRDDQIIAQPLLATGEPEGGEVAMFEGTPAFSVGFVHVAANESKAFVLYVISNTAWVRSFDLELSTFGGAIDLFTAPQGFISADLAASPGRAVALLATLADANDVVFVKAVSVDVGLDAPTSPTSVYEGPPTAALANFASLAVAPPRTTGAPWPVTYSRAETSTSSESKMLVGLTDTAHVSISAKPIRALVYRQIVLATGEDDGLFAWMESGFLRLQLFDATTLVVDPGGAVSNDSSVTSTGISLDRLLGRWVVGYVRDISAGNQLTVAVFDDALTREDLMSSLVGHTISKVDGAVRDDGAAFLVGGVSARPEVFVLGCAE